MSNTYTKDKLIKEVITGNRRMSRAMNNVSNALEKINDQNVLHTTAVENNNKIIQKLVTSNKWADWSFRLIVLLLIAALIVIAGAEKAFKILPFMK